MSRNREDPDTIGHNDVPALADDLEAGLLQRRDRRALTHAWNLWHLKLLLRPVVS
jgi:hypothetical protein